MSFLRVTTLFASIYLTSEPCSGAGNTGSLCQPSLHDSAANKETIMAPPHLHGMYPITQLANMDRHS